MAKEERDENSDPVDFLCYTSEEFEEERKEIMYWFSYFL